MRVVTADEGTRLRVEATFKREEHSTGCKAIRISLHLNFLHDASRDTLAKIFQQKTPSPLPVSLRYKMALYEIGVRGFTRLDSNFIEVVKNSHFHNAGTKKTIDLPLGIDYKLVLTEDFVKNPERVELFFR